MKTLGTSEDHHDRAPVETRERFRCDGTVLIHHDLSMSCTADSCPVPHGSDEWLMAHTSFHGCDYVLRRCESCSVEPAAPPWGDSVHQSAA